MKRIFYSVFLLLTIASQIVFAAQETNTPLTFAVRQQNYMFSTSFEISSPKQHLGSVVKSALTVRTHYYLYDATGNSEGLGICRLLTLGALYSWGSEIDVYDENGLSIGVIDGQIATGAAAKFSIYNFEGTKVGIAYLDKNNSSFTVVNPNNENQQYASLRRNFIHNAVDHWDVIIYNMDAIDLRILKIFAAFAVDSQDDFKKDT